MKSCNFPLKCYLKENKKIRNKSAADESDTALATLIVPPTQNDTKDRCWELATEQAKKLGFERIFQCEVLPSLIYLFDYKLFDGTMVDRFEEIQRGVLLVTRHNVHR